ncbi:hypothetical protein NPIL_47441 [Nephila pilipes]|uniref:Uncharacterized protein n=1 Tax=Nephila pilipes TaxID=299642 RepID=A0A8X6MZZ7_NEPPI|nr:hypothetical protein NPIL_47441 [Nephila pilipes]
MAPRLFKEKKAPFSSLSEVAGPPPPSDFSFLHLSRANLRELTIFGHQCFCPKTICSSKEEDSFMIFRTVAYGIANFRATPCATGLVFGVPDDSLIAVIILSCMGRGSSPYIFYSKLSSLLEIVITLLSELCVKVPFPLRISFTRLNSRKTAAVFKLLTWNRIKIKALSGKLRGISYHATDRNDRLLFLLIIKMAFALAASSVGENNNGV